MILDYAVHQSISFHKATTAKLNEDKTIILAINDPSLRTNIGRIKVIREGSVDYLGLPIDGDTDHRIWSKKHLEIKGAIQQWRLSFLSIRQRVAVAKIGLVSKLWHLLRCIPARHEDLDPIQRTLWKYVWELPDSAKASGPIANAQVL